MIGVDYELFWNLNPKSLSPFVKAFVLKQKYDEAICWKTGVYIKLAISSSFDKNTKYPKKPFGVDGESDGTMTPEQIKRKMMAQMELINSNFRKEG